MLDVSMLHTRVDGDNADMALISKADVRDDEKNVRPTRGPMLDVAGSKVSVEIFEDDQPHEIEDCQDPEQRGPLEEVNPLGEAEGKNAYDAGDRHGEVPIHVEFVTKVGTHEGGEYPVKLVPNHDQKRDAGAEAVDRHANGAGDAAKFSTASAEDFLDSGCRARGGAIGCVCQNVERRENEYDEDGLNEDGDQHSSGLVEGFGKV